MVITYDLFNIWSWDKNHSTQHEMAIPVIKILQKIKENIAIKWLNAKSCYFCPLTNKHS